MHSQKTILLTGATGYIGSHTWCALIAEGFRVIGIDNHINSSSKVIDRIAAITGTAPEFIYGDVTQETIWDAIFDQYKIDAVVHFAAHKAVGESVLNPIDYYRNNVGGLISLIRGMERNGLKKIVFSSSATVYGDPVKVPIDEDFPIAPQSPYGQTKAICEKVLADLVHSNDQWRVASLRYFNPVGAHPTGLIGEDPKGVPNNLMPYVAQVAIGLRPFLNVFGGDYPTLDGTGVRDYIHVMDLAQGHVAALSSLLEKEGSLTVNLGTGCGYSVLELIRAYERASGKTINYRITERRPGDVAACYADVQSAFKQLRWKATRGLEEMCIDSWRWQSQNPNGYS